MAAAGVGKLFLASVLLFCFVGTCYGINLGEIKNNTLIVTASPDNTTILKAGVNNITVKWELSANTPGMDSEWKTISLKLCYAPISQKDRAWRKTVDPISKDKTCQFKIASVAYGTQKNVTWIVQRNTPTAYYFVRAYALNAAGHEVAYGQTTNSDKNTNIFFVEAVTGRHVSLDIASIVFSAFSVLSLVFFFWLEKSKGKRA